MYTPLYIKSNYSLLSSLISIDSLLNFCKENKLSSICLTDNNMSSTMEFYKKATSQNIKPITGLELTLKEDKLLVYAKNYEGYKKLIKLSTIQSERIIELEDLIDNENTIIAIPYQYKELYSQLKGDIYLGYTNDLEREEVAKLTNKVIYLKEVLFLKENEHKYLEYLYMIRDSKTIDTKEEFKDKDKYFSLTIPDQYKRDNLEVINKCNLVFPKETELYLPIFDTKSDLTPEQYLSGLAYKGMIKRVGSKDPKYLNRLNYELDTIKKLGFANYFLVVYDFIFFAKKKGILVGPGRGSAAGSLVSYCLGITDIDPLEYDLLFERFLNAERITMPDIDIDFPDIHRDEVIEYVKEKYGSKRVASIITFGTLGTKQALRDVGRILNVPIYKIDGLCKAIPTVTKNKLKDFYEKDHNFKSKIDSDISLQKVYDIAKFLEGTPRHTSTHAAGIIMSKKNLDEIIPLVKHEDGYLSGYSMEHLEELGLLKMDFLGLKNLSTIMNIIKDVKNNRNIDIDFNKISLNDEKTLNIFAKANTSGIFQFESNGMRNFLRNLRPNRFEDIFAAIALFRPGPAVNIDSYIKRRHNEEKVTYLDPSLEKVLSNTYGIIIYQEQIMQIASIYANYSLGDADILRRAMSKKKKDVLLNEKDKFIKGSLSNNHDLKQAEVIFELILNFAGYGFNRSHSVAYAIIAYKMAYLKTYFKEEFFSNLLSSVIGSETKTKEYIKEARNNNIKIVKPTISKSSKSYLVEENSIIYPLSNIKGIGTVIISDIITAKNQKFEDIYDCLSKLYINKVGKKTIETLILAGALSEFNYNKRTLVENLDSLMNYAELTKDLDPSLVMKPEIELKEEYDNNILLEQEKELFGFYISNHPVTMYRNDNKNIISVEEITNHFNKKIYTIILIESKRVITTKNDNEMAFINGSDETGMMDFTLFPNIYEEYKDIEKGKVYLIEGTVEKRFDQYQVIVRKMKQLNK